MSDTPNGFDQWAIVDVMGHQRYAGRVTEETLAGAGFIRVDVPEVKRRNHATDDDVDRGDDADDDPDDDTVF